MQVHGIIRFAVERRVTMAMFVLGVMVLGWLSLNRLPLEFLPAFSSSTISVTASYPSSSPDETERLIVRHLEDSLGSINGIDSLTASATAQSASVRLGFRAGTDMDLAAVEVRDRVDRVRHLLPDDLERVRIRRFQSSDRPSMSMNVSAPWDRDRLFIFLEEVLQGRLMRLEGVADISIRGLEVREVKIELLQNRLAAHSINVRDITSLLRTNHLEMSGGVIREGSRSLLVRVEGKLSALSEIRALPINSRGLRLEDVADISFGYPERDSFNFLNGNEAVSLQVYKTSTANLLEMTGLVHSELEAICALPESEGLGVTVFRDDSVDVRQGLGELRKTGLLGGGLAIVFMYLFLRRFRTTILVALAIPVSVVMTFVLMYLIRVAGWSDITLNIMTLMGLMLAVGMLVDNSIVVIESIFRHRQELGEDAVTATLRGASEVVRPIAASTLTTMCVFLPLVFLSLGGRFAFFMKNIGVTVIAVMAASFLVAITVVPMVAARLLRREVATEHRFFDRVTAAYAASLRFTLRHRLVFAGLSVLTLLWTWHLYQGIGRSFSPPSFERRLSVSVDTPKSFGIEQKLKLYAEIYARIDGHRRELQITDIAHGFKRGSGRSRGWRGGNRFDIYLTDDEGGLDMGDVRDRIEGLLPEAAGVRFTVARSMRGRHSSSGANLEMRLEGDRMEMLEKLSSRVVEAMASISGLQNVDTSLESGDEEIRVQPNRVKALQAGLSTQVIGQSISSALSSRPVAYLEVGDHELDIVVQYREEDRQTLEQLKNLPLSSGDRAQSIGSMVDFEMARGARSIEREDRRSSVTITADTKTGTPSFMAQRLARKAVDLVDLPAGYEVVEGRDFRMGGEDAGEALFMFAFALALVYMVMAALFESFAQPFTIMLSVPFAFIGVGIIMKLAGQARSSTADMGLIILAGIVVNNAIVLVDHINQLRASGMDREEAIVVGGRHRLRPILMTAATTILGLSPMVAPFFFPEVFGAIEGRAAFWAPVGLVILGGLTTSTLLTVMVIPTFYSLIDDLSRFSRRVVFELSKA